MNENLNNWERLKKAFEDFEPEVSGNWEAMRSRLDRMNVGGHNSTEHFIRRAKVAERFALGATAVAVGLAFFVFGPIESNSSLQILGGNHSEDALITDMNRRGVESGFEQNRPGFFPSEGAPANESSMKIDMASIVDYSGQPARFDGHVARTSKRVVVQFPAPSPSKMAASKLEDVDLTDGSEAHSKSRGTESSALVQNSLNSVLDLNGESRANSEEPSGDLNATKNTAANALNNGAEVRAISEEIDASSINISMQEACAGTEVSFALDGIDEAGSVLWNFGDGDFSQLSAPSHIFNSPGTYDITVSVRAPGDGMIRTRTVENMIVVRPKPEAQMSWDFQAIDEVSQVGVHFIDETKGASSSAWILKQKDLPLSIAALDVPGIYPVNLIASNAYGCQDVAAESIKLYSRKEALAPARFSPNGDGRYDTFMPLVVSELSGDWRLTIWDEGQVVYSTTEYNLPWDGILENGVPAIAGNSYRWQLETLSPDHDHVLFMDEVDIED
ncbi:PKD domain-containing protein [Flavobacteriales bacterium]|nr:PKD domain-containing protein [Flavobacteriales bacterium]